MTLQMLETPTAELNPFCVMRAKLKMTQTQVADRTGNTENYVRRLEHGLVSAPSATLTKIFWEEKLTGHKYTAREGVAELKFIVGTLRTRLIHAKGSNLPYSAFNYTEITNSYEFEQFVNVWWDAWIHVMRMEAETPVTNHLSNGFSVYSFCRALCLHQYVVQYYIKHNSNLIPKTVLDALNQTGQYSYWYSVLQALAGREALLSEDKDYEDD